MDEKTVFISLLRDYVNASEECSVNKTFDYELVYDLAKIHSLGGVFAVIKNKYSINFPKQISEKLDLMLAATVKQSVVWEYLYNEVSKALSDNEVTNIVVKGPVVKRYYPDPDLRSMGDLDLVVNIKDIPKAKNVMEKMGFKLENGSNDEYKYCRNGLYVELHEDLTSRNYGTGVNYKKEMQNLFANTIDQNNYSTELTEEYHLIYLMLHTAQHLTGMGCGVRQILDIAFFVKNGNADLSVVRQIADELKLTKFCETMFFVCKKWFGIDCTDYIPNLKWIEKLEDYIISGGTFGFEDSFDRATDWVARDGVYERNRLVFFWKRLFPDIEVMRKKVLWFADKPAVFLPFAYVFRWVRSGIKHPKEIILYMKKIIVDKKKVEENLDFMRELGFYKKDSERR